MTRERAILQVLGRAGEYQKQTCYLFGTHIRCGSIPSQVRRRLNCRRWTRILPALEVVYVVDNCFPAFRPEVERFERGLELLFLLRERFQYMSQLLHEYLGVR
jgi:hypothetical protein